MIKQLENANESCSEYLADLVITQVDNVPFAELADQARHAQKRNLLTYVKALLLGELARTEGNSKTHFIKISFSSETEEIDDEFYLVKHPQKEAKELDNYTRGDVISVLLGWDTYAMVYNHDTNVLNHCYDAERLRFVTFRGIFPAFYGCRIIEQVAACIPDAHQKGDFAKRGATPRAKTDHSNQTTYPVFSTYDKLDDAFKAVLPWLGAFCKIVAVLVVSCLAALVFYLIYKFCAFQYCMGSHSLSACS